MLAFYLAAPEVENDRRSLNTIAGMRRAMKEGRHVNMAPKGYKNARDEANKPIIVPSKDASHIVFAFDEVARGVHNIMDVWRMVKERGFKVGKSQFWNILRNPIYCGRIFIPAYKDEEAVIKRATHEPLISEMLFDDVQDILIGRKRKFSVKKTLRDEFPLRGFLECRVCGGKLTGSASKGNGGRYFYYHCTKGCKERFKVEEANKALLHKMSSMKPNQGSVQALELIIKDSEKPNSEKELMQKGLLRDIEKYKQRIRNIQEQLADKEISGADYQEMRSRYERDIREMERQLLQIRASTKNFKEQLEFIIEVVINLSKYYDSADLFCKQQIIGSVFPEKLIFENGKLRTKKINEAVELICRNNKVLQPSGKKKSSDFSELSNVVPGTGIEPAHPCEGQILRMLR